MTVGLSFFCLFARLGAVQRYIFKESCRRTGFWACQILYAIYISVVHGSFGHLGIFAAHRKWLFLTLKQIDV